MRTTICILAVLCTLCLANCSSFGGGTASAPVYETGGGHVIKRSGSYVDGLRGAHVGRDAEQMKFARDLIYLAGNRNSDEFNTRYTGRVKVYVWKGRDRETKYSSMREIRWKDGSRSWQGQNPATNFYSARDLTQYIISDTSEPTLAMLRAGGVSL